MKIRPHIVSTFWLFLAVGLLQACGVDPLESPEFGPSSDPSKNGYSVCADPTLVDTDKDSMNDECERLLGTNPNSDDQDGNGIPDGRQLTPNYVLCNGAQIPSNLNCEEINKEQDGQNNKTLNDTAKSSLLANAGLNAKAPNGTKVEVQKQIIRIVLKHSTDNTSSGLKNEMSPSGIQDASDILQYCKNGNVILDTFIYYHIEGDVMFCNATKGSSSGCEPKSEKTHAVMKLCGPLPTLTTNDPGLEFVQNNFNWTWGYVKNEKYTGPFDPTVLHKNKNDSAKLTLKPNTPESQVYKNVDVKFEKVLQLGGTIYDYTHEQNININSTQSTSVTRHFKRAFPYVINKTYTPYIVGPYEATN